MVDVYSRLTTRTTVRIRSPKATLCALRAAWTNRSTTVKDGGVRAYLRDIDEEYTFVRDSEAGSDGYYRLTVRENGLTVLEASVLVAVVANATADRAPLYENLSPGEQRTVDAVLANSLGDDIGYRPRKNDPFVTSYRPGSGRETPSTVYTYGHIDDFGPGFVGFVVGLGVAAIGIVLILVGDTDFGYDWWTG